MLHTHEVTGSSPVVSTRYYIEDLCNGSTPDSDSVCGGSNPSSPAKKKRHASACLFFLAGARSAQQTLRLWAGIERARRSPQTSVTRKPPKAALMRATTPDGFPRAKCRRFAPVARWISLRASSCTHSSFPIKSSLLDIQLYFEAYEVSSWKSEQRNYRIWMRLRAWRRSAFHRRRQRREKILKNVWRRIEITSGCCLTGKGLFPLSTAW